jgi:hypothetical protein
VAEEPDGARQPVVWSALFHPPERVGWEFRDRNAQRQRFDAPCPDWVGRERAQRSEQSVVQHWLGDLRYAAWLATVYGVVADLVWPVVVKRVFGGPRPRVIDLETGRTAQQERVEGEFARRMALALPVGGVVFTAVLVWRLTATLRHLPLGSPVEALVVSVIVAGVVGAVWIGLVVAHRRAVRDYWQRSYQVYRATQLEPWRAAGARYAQDEHRRLAGISDWASAQVTPGFRRVDVVGGNLFGWEALLTVAGSSILAGGGALTVLDLTGDIVAAELVRGARALGREVAFALLPTELADVDLLDGLDVAQVVNLFVEARHGGPGQPERGTRAVDERILTAVCEVLALGGLSMGRIAAGLRVLMDAPATDQVLTDKERATLAGETFSDEYRRQTFGNAKDLEAMAHPLSAMGTVSTGPLEGQLRVVAMSSVWTSAQDDFLADLLVGWVARQVAEDPRSVPTLILAGAGRLALRHIHRLSDLCDRRGVRLVTMFRHWDQAADEVVGAGPVAFMRLGNHQQAKRAAEFIGLEYRFELSQLTTSLGGQESVSTADSESTTEGAGGSHTTGTGSSDSQSRGNSGRPSWWRWNTDTSRSWNRSRSTSWNKSDTTSWNRSRTWGHTVTESTGSNWSNSEGKQRVHEYRVEPEVIKNLPDYALLLVEPTGDGKPRQIRAVEVNPEIALLDAEPFAGTDPAAWSDALAAPATQSAAIGEQDGQPRMIRRPRLRREITSGEAPSPMRAGWLSRRQTPAQLVAQWRQRRRP